MEKNYIITSVEYSGKVDRDLFLFTLFMLVVLIVVGVSFLIFNKPILKYATIMSACIWFVVVFWLVVGFVNFDKEVAKGFDKNLLDMTIRYRETTLPETATQEEIETELKTALLTEKKFNLFDVDNLFVGSFFEDSKDNFSSENNKYVNVMEKAVIDAGSRDAIYRLLKKIKEDKIGRKLHVVSKGDLHAIHVFKKK